MRAVGHEHAITAREREIGGQRGTLVAALFLDDLHQHDLAALDDVLDLVAAAQRHAAGARLVAGLGLAATAIATTATTAIAAIAVILARFFGFAFALAFVAVGIAVIVARKRLGADRLFVGLDQALVRQSVVIAAFFATAAGGVIFLFLGGECFSLFARVAGLFGKQRDLVLARDLVIVGMDFREGEKAMPVAAIIDESRLQRGFYASNLGEIDIALDLLVFGRFKVEFLNPVSLEHRHPGFFLVARIDQHARCHSIFSVRAHRAEPAGSLRFCLLWRWRSRSGGRCANGFVR